VLAEHAHFKDGIINNPVQYARLSVQELIVACMRDVDVITKDETNPSQGYRFRGVDATMNTVGPIIRKHGLICVPLDMTIEADERYTARNGGIMRSVTVKVAWMFVAPDGTTMHATTLGEAADSSDKAVPKAMAVAFRELWLKSFCVPTDDKDVDQAPAPDRVADAAPGPTESEPGLMNRLTKTIQRARTVDPGLKNAWAEVAQHGQERRLATADAERLLAYIKQRIEEMQNTTEAPREDEGNGRSEGGYRPEDAPEGLEP
jgi:hypothetical protein